MCNYVQQQRSLAKQICLSLIKIASAHNTAMLQYYVLRHIFHWYLLFWFRLKEHLFNYLHPSFIIYCSSFAYHALLTSVSQMIFPLKGEHFCLNNFIVYLQSTSIVPLFTFYGEIIKCELMQKTTSITVDYSSADRFSLRGKKHGLFS
jgi:hypothetical protein